ncbi:IclR family transcriptional regulator domain-containing protein [Salinibacterium sedimenticola]|uniref:IclR family transcriptional regulator domain-containing protein n=1 Tax=Homoserinimonas sedimenticola TaxID=2986805 RepID=UPI0035576D29
MSLSEVARRTGLTRATARRFLLTLCELGYVRTDGKVFALTVRVLDLGYSYLSGLRLQDLAMQHLERLAATVQETTSVSVLDGTDIVYVARVPTKRIMSIGITIGTRFPAHATSMGRVLLAALPPEEVATRYASVPLERRTSRTIAALADLLAELERVRAQGWSLTDQELEHGLRSMAMPIADAQGRVLAAVNVSSHVSTRDAASFRALVAEPLADAVRGIESELARTSAVSRLMASH